MAFNPNIVFISPSSLSDFEKCPQLYYYRYVYKTPRGLKIQTINPSLALGQSVHDALNQFLTTTLPLERTEEELKRIFEWTWNGLSGEKGGFSNQEEEQEYKNRGLGMISRFLKNKHFLESEMVKIASFPKIELGNDLMLTGKIDWLEKDGEGYQIIDFKTGKNEEKEDSKQLPIYALLASKILQSNNIKASYWYLDKDENTTSFNLPNLEETLSELKKKGEIIKMVRQTQSYHCQSGEESCWACKEILAVVQGKGKLVSVDAVNRKQEIYILPKTENKKTFEVADDLPF